MNPERLEELAALHALGLLDEAERAEFEALVASDPQAAALAKECADAVAGVALTLPPASPPARLRSAVLDRQLPQRIVKGPWHRGMIPWAMAAGFALAALAFWNQNQSTERRADSLAQEVQTLQDQLTAISAQRDRLAAELGKATGERDEVREKLEDLEAEAKSLQLKMAALQSKDPLDGLRVVRLDPQPGVWKGNGLVAVWDEKRREGRLDLEGLANANPDKDYQLWIISPDAPQPISAGVLITADGHGSQNFRLEQAVSQVAALAVSVEPRGGSAAPTGPVILVGNIN